MAKVPKTDLVTRRCIFDEMASLYDKARPTYPEVVINDLLHLAATPTLGEVVEVGCGSGQASLAIAGRGLRISCIDPSPHMIAIARQKLERFPLAKFYVVRFEDWDAEGRRFDLLLSATAFHLVDPGIRYQRASAILKPGGSLALLWNLLEENELNLTVVRALRGSSAGLVEEAGSRPMSSNRDPMKEEILNSGLFSSIQVRHYHWELIYDVASYVNLLATHYNDAVANPLQRKRVLECLSDSIKTGTITQSYRTALYVARRD